MATKTPDLNLLPIAFALYDELSVSRAARVLGMSQPAVSMALVLSPLIALMKDQVDDLNRRGIVAAALHSGRWVSYRSQGLCSNLWGATLGRPEYLYRDEALSSIRSHEQ